MKTIKKLAKWLAFTITLLLTANLANTQQTAPDSTVINRISALEQQEADQKPGESHFMVFADRWTHSFSGRSLGVSRTEAWIKVRVMRNDMPKSALT